MTPGINDVLDPFLCSCLPTSSHNLFCNKIKWSTVSITTALIIIIVYASSGLYTLIDVTTLMSIQSTDGRNETIFWSILSSPMTIILSWLSLSVYFIVVLFIIILLCGIQLSKPWLLFLWSILMIFMLVTDGIVTVLSLRQHQQQIEAYRPSKQVKILFCVMIIRLIVSLSAIFITVFHFRQLNQAKLEYINRQRMLDRYNTECVSSSYDGSWTHSDSLLDPSKDGNNDHYKLDFSSSMSLPRAQVATIQRHPISTMFHSRNTLQPQIQYTGHSHQQRPMSGYNEDYQYNIPLQERFLQQKITDVQEL